MTAPLDGALVLDFGQGVAGPYCAMLLADLGADVVKIEPPRGDWARNMGSTVAPGMGTTYLAVNRGKRSLCLDLARPNGRAVARRLAETADIVVESFRPGVMGRLGLGYDGLAEARPALVYCSITGYGPDGPSAHLPAGDSVMQAYGGLMSINGDAGGPPLRVDNVVSDMLAGLFGLNGIMAALLTRERSGRGDRVEVSLLDALVAFQAPPLAEYLATGTMPARAGGAHPLLAPSGTYATRDGAIVFSVLNHQWEAFCRNIGAEQLLRDARFADNAARLAHREALTALLAPAFSARTTAEGLKSLRRCDVLCAPINDYATLVGDPQVAWNGLVETLTHPEAGVLPAIGNPVRGGGHAAAMRPPPLLGEDGEAVLSARLGLSPGDISALAQDGSLILPPATRSGVAG